MKRSANTHQAVVVAGLLALLLAPGCGGGDDSEADVDAGQTDAAADTGPSGDSSQDAAAVDVASKPKPKPPNVKLSNPGDGAVLHGEVTIEATASAARSHVAIAQLRFKLNGSTFALLNKAPWTLKWDTDNVAEGKHQLSVVALDTAGSNAKHSISIEIARSGPSIGFSKPAQYALVDGDKEPVELTVTVGEPAPTEVAFSVKQGSATLKLDTLTKAPWTTKWFTQGRDSGDWTLIATATDSKGMSASTLRHVVLDRPPTVKLVQPDPGSTVGGVVVVKAETGDDLGVAELRIELDGQPLAAKAAKGTTFALSTSWDSSKVGGGKHVLKARCIDSGGHTTEVSLDVTVDQPMTAQALSCSDVAFAKCDAIPPPSLPLKGKVGLKVVISDDTAKPATATWKIDGKLLAELAKPPLQWLWDTTKVADGPHQLTVKAYNDKGDSVDLSYAVSINNCDLDNDGHLSDSASCGGDDCDDGAPKTYAGAKDLVGDGTDQNCDGVDGADLDGDGWLSKASGGKDCDDGDKAVHPCVDDKAGDGVDQDCDGSDQQGCDDCESCTLDAPGGDGCVHLAFNDGSLCKDDKPCTSGEACSGGECKAAKTTSCDDGNPCTMDICDGKGGCVNDKLADGEGCGDGKTCKAGVCG